jgi:hypothetical protein
MAVVGAPRGRSVVYKIGVTATPLRELAARQRLERRYADVRDVHPRDLFASDSDRRSRLTAESAGLLLDFSKHRVTDDTVRLLVELAGSLPWPAVQTFTPPGRP